MVILFLVIHILVCVLVYLMIRLNILKCGPMVMQIVCFVPVWGLGCLLVLEIRSRGKQKIREEVGIEKLKINDEVYRSILMEEDPMAGRVVPLEEALLINEPAMRRELMLEIMYEDPSSYISQLQSARMNDDTEVVHYAVTALAEQQKKYDLQFQELEYQMEQDPENVQLQEDYLELLEQYLASGLLEGNAKKIRLRQYADMLGKKCGEDADMERVYCRLAEANLMLEEYEEAWKNIQTLLEKWPEQEQGYLYQIQYYALKKNRAGITETLELIRQREVYLSHKGRGIVEFWKEEEWERIEA
ncbi:MAG: hypothetical protein Q4E24_03140 [bacterium]|nr:hypothetical protein [bacterium]